KDKAQKQQTQVPNRIIKKRKKVAGILTEMQAEQDQIQYVVIGVGLNILHDKADLPKDLQHKMSSIKLTTKTDIDITKFIQEILSTFESTYSLYLNDGFRSEERR